jgi:hypothetical protein
VPHGARRTELDGDLQAVRCLPPDPTAEARW